MCEPEANSAYTVLADAVIEESEEVKLGFVLDFDDVGRLVGIEAHKKSALELAAG